MTYICVSTEKKKYLNILDFLYYLLQLIVLFKRTNIDIEKYALNKIDKPTIAGWNPKIKLY